MKQFDRNKSDPATKPAVGTFTIGTNCEMPRSCADGGVCYGHCKVVPTSDALKAVLALGLGSIGVKS